MSEYQKDQAAVNQFMVYFLNLVVGVWALGFAISQQNHPVVAALAVLAAIFFIFGGLAYLIRRLRQLG